MLLRVMRTARRELGLLGLLLAGCGAEAEKLDPLADLPFRLEWKSVRDDFSSNAVHFAGKSAGWVVGDNGAILATRNGGARWARQTSGTDLDLRAVDFLDERRGWIGGSRFNFSVSRNSVHGVILRTVDGGERWERVGGDLKTFINCHGPQPSASARARSGEEP